jgi:CBS domain-containing protein
LIRLVGWEARLFYTEGATVSEELEMKDLIARDIMNPDVIVAQESMTIQELTDFLTSNMITGAPVVDELGKLVGVVSETDVVRSGARWDAALREKRESSYYLRGWEDKIDEDELGAFHVIEDEGLKVRDIMTPLIFKVSEKTSIAEMADTMIGGRIHRLIVTRDDRVVGIVTTLDMLKAIRSYAT